MFDNVYAYWVQRKIPPAIGVCVVLMRDFLRVLLLPIDSDWFYRGLGCLDRRQWHMCCLVERNYF